MKQIELSIVIPVYNEEKRLGGIKKIDKWLKKHKIRGEIIVVNDGSMDRTMDILNIEYRKLNIVSYQNNRGKGYAVKQGVLASKGKWVMFCDIDLSVDVSSILNIWTSKEKDSVIIASRRTKGAVVKIRQDIFREFLGVGFSFMARWVSGVEVSDFTCGCKLMETSKAKKIFKHIKIDRWAFDVEVLWRAKNMGMEIVEVPVVWKNNKNSKVRLGRDIVTSFFDLMQMRGR